MEGQQVFKDQNWNSISGAYPRASRCAAMALFIGGGPHLRICGLHDGKLVAIVVIFFRVYFIFP